VIYQPPPQCITPYIEYSAPPFTTKHRFIHSIVDFARIFVHRPSTVPGFTIPAAALHRGATIGATRQTQIQQEFQEKQRDQRRPLHDTRRKDTPQRRRYYCTVRPSHLQCHGASASQPSPSRRPRQSITLFTPARRAETRWGPHPWLFLERGVDGQHSCPPASA
jgi:hypothetical protein